STFGIALAAVALAASMTIHTEDQPRMRTVRFLVSPAPEIPLRSLAVAPNGSAVVYRGIEQGTTRLYVREIDELETRPIPGTESASQPFFSPNGEWLGFYTDREIRRVPVGGGSPVTISAKATDPLYGATWGSDDVIVYGASDGNLMRVPAFGGEAEILAAPDPAQGETGLRWPTYLPNGRDLVFTASAGDPTISRIGTYQARSDEARRLLIVGTQALSAGTGHLIVWQADESVVAVPFDEDRLVTTGDGVVVLRGVGALALSSEGSLAMMPAVSEPQRLVLVDATGSERPLADQERTFPSEEWEWGFLYPRFGPSGDRVALATDGHIWVYDLGQGTLQKLTFEGENTFPSWTPDGMDIVFSSGREGRRSLYTVPANGSGTPELLLESANLAWESGISRDGEWIAFTEGFQDLSTKVDVVAASLHSTEGQRIPIAQTRYNERSTDLSPDGRWIAYVSNESGRDEVYVSAFPRPGARTQVSIDGGNSPTWASDGETLYYRATSGMQAAMLEAGPSVRVTDHRTLFDDSPYVRSLYYANYDVDPVSGDFLMTVRGDGASAQIVLVVNWSEELKRLMGG
ncbi:MAG: hypothetical protein PVJ04_13590, partial [Gemmatimonadota bacterium]